MAGQTEAKREEVYDGRRAGRSACEASAVWRIDLALSGSRGQSVEEVGNVMSVCLHMYTAEVMGRACHWWEGVFDGGNSEVKFF